MAIGLERNGQRFLWAIQAPCTGIKQASFSANDMIFILPTNANLDELLPEGFIERTKSKGLVWPLSVPQTEILAHLAVRGFVTHSGWNSILESLWFGVPMFPWPLYAEQSLNAFVTVKEIGVTLDLKLDAKDKSFVTADELERAVRCLMDGSDGGKSVRAKTKEVKREFRKALVGGKLGNYILRTNKIMFKILLI